ncbi:hypothetical protein UCRPA7_153 [Phaeoacremonium minimum UCRPA7]|uniref:Uncharacterized protein n=1 Tax=Phaeoacremonium minimum (strain UCR-PA7) TaxID=1286976 RepID=R8BY79_PHAM7|nr:hypothetical protein UCRPA7_153 [Phaeoacremonium minimum UCRPA7]EOO04313.1 hypothetical protein UCRPA7_153 [Phaeoacremonium minimum UCRPA7]
MSSGAIVPRGRRSHSPGSSGSEDERDRSPLAKARHVLKDTFSQSNSGLGVGVLGAIVGGIAAREASEATLRARGKSHSGEHDKSTLVSTIIGAAVGGLGANALEKRLESAKKKDEEKREEGGRRSHGPIRGANADYYDNDDYDYVYDRKTRHR